MHQRARTDPSGGRGATRVPTGTQGNADLELIPERGSRRALDQASYDLNVGRYLPDMVEQGVQHRHCREPVPPRGGTLPLGSTLGQRCRMLRDCCLRT